MTYQRKPIQIAAVDGGMVTELYALAQDGSIWRCVPDADHVSWGRVPPLPEGEPCGVVANRPDAFACELIEGHAGVHYSSGLGAF